MPISSSWVPGGRLSIFRFGYKFLPAGENESEQTAGGTPDLHVADWLDCIRSRQKRNADYEKSRVVPIKLGHGRRAHMNLAYQRLVKNAIARAASRPVIPESLCSDLTLHAGFDGSFDATIASGDRRIYHGPSYQERDKAQPGSGDADVEIARGEGLRGDAPQCKTKNTRALFFNLKTAFQAGANELSC